MYLVRDIMHCKPGKVRPIVEQFKKLNAELEKIGIAPFRIYTDFSGAEFWTAVFETEVETIDQFQEEMDQAMGNEEVRAAMAGYHDLAIGGRREIYNVES